MVLNLNFPIKKRNSESAIRAFILNSKTSEIKNSPKLYVQHHAF
jgi:hypothetical protein